MGERLAAFVQDQVKSGRYQDAAGAVRAALHLLESHGVPDGPPNDAEIHAMVEEGLASGMSDGDPDAFSDGLDAEYAAPAAAQRKEG